MHVATRVRKGLYHYRGHEIEYVGYYDTDSNWWNIRELSEDSAHDAEQTLRQCKRSIDRWLDK